MDSAALKKKEEKVYGSVPSYELAANAKLAEVKAEIADPKLFPIDQGDVSCMTEWLARSPSGRSQRSANTIATDVIFAYKVHMFQQSDEGKNLVKKWKKRKKSQDKHESSTRPPASQAGPSSLGQGPVDLTSPTPTKGYSVRPFFSNLSLTQTHCLKPLGPHCAQKSEGKKKARNA